jgi:hypothetical protein
MALKTLGRTVAYAGLAKDAYRLRRADNEVVRSQARRHLIERMGKLRGLPQKLGQMMSFSGTREDDDPLAADDFATLQESAEPLALGEVQPVIENEWQCPLSDVLAHINPLAHAASLGQVHRARTIDGRDVAVKVQYPGIGDSIQTDLKLLGWLSAPVGNLRRGFDLSAYRQVILDDLQKELDYRREAEHQRRFANWADEDARLAVPRVVDELSTDRVLVTEWQSGDTWQQVKADWTDADKRKLARTLLGLFLDGLFGRGMMHADLHPGNLRFRRPHGSSSSGLAQVLMYDFGCVYFPENDDRLTLLRLIRATMRGDESPWPLFLKLGFNKEFLEPLADKLPALCRILFEPFCVEYPYDPADWRLAERVADILGDDRWNFRIAGPASMIFLLRAFHGLAYYMEGLQRPVMWHRAIRPLIDRFGADMNRLDLPAAESHHRDFGSLAKYLKIRVREDGRTKVELTSYAAGIDDLDGLLDDDLKRRIAAQQIDLSTVVTQVRQRGYTPGPVFELTEGNKEVAVWLQ